MYTYRFTLDRIVDGDTVDISIDLGFDIRVKKRVRLSGINAPETRTLNPEEKVAGLAAKKFLNTLLYASAGSGPMTIRTDIDKTGKFGRVLGVLYVGATNVNQLMLDNGHAFPYGTKWGDVHDN
mgnify:CR=1 FL=1